MKFDRVHRKLSQIATSDPAAENNRADTYNTISGENIPPGFAAPAKRAELLKARTHQKQERAFSFPGFGWI